MLGQKRVEHRNDNGSIEFSHTTELETFFVFVELRVCGSYMTAEQSVSTVVIEMQTQCSYLREFLLC